VPFFLNKFQNGIYGQFQKLHYRNDKHSSHQNGEIKLWEEHTSAIKMRKKPYNIFLILKRDYKVGGNQLMHKYVFYLRQDERKKKVSSCYGKNEKQ
jgi:hypothetical protein